MNGFDPELMEAMCAAFHDACRSVLRAAGVVVAPALDVPFANAPVWARVADMAGMLAALRVLQSDDRIRTFEEALEAARLEERDALRAALGLALAKLHEHEPPDSRFVSDEFVAMAAIQCGLTDAVVMQVIHAAIRARGEEGRAALAAHGTKEASRDA